MLTYDHFSRYINVYNSCRVCLLEITGATPLCFYFSFQFPCNGFGAMNRCSSPGLTFSCPPRSVSFGVPLWLTLWREGDVWGWRGAETSRFGGMGEVWGFFFFFLSLSSSYHSFLQKYKYFEYIWVLCVWCSFFCLVGSAISTVQAWILRKQIMQNTLIPNAFTRCWLYVIDNKFEYGLWQNLYMAFNVNFRCCNHFYFILLNACISSCSIFWQGPVSVFSFLLQ